MSGRTAVQHKSGKTSSHLSQRKPCPIITLHDECIGVLHKLLPDKFQKVATVESTSKMDVIVDFVRAEKVCRQVGPPQEVRTQAGGRVGGRAGGRSRRQDRPSQCHTRVLEGAGVKMASSCTARALHSITEPSRGQAPAAIRFCSRRTGTVSVQLFALVLSV